MRRSLRGGWERLATTALVTTLLVTLVPIMALPVHAQDDTAEADATVRAINAVPGVPEFDVLLDGQPLMESLPYGTARGSDPGPSRVDGAGDHPDRRGSDPGSGRGRSLGRRNGRPRRDRGWGGIANAGGPNREIAPDPAPAPAQGRARGVGYFSDDFLATSSHPLRPLIAGGQGPARVDTIARPSIDSPGNGLRRNIATR